MLKSSANSMKSKTTLRKTSAAPSFLEFWPIPALLIAIFGFYHKIFLVQGAWLVGDHAEQHFPWQNYLSQSLKLGFFPFWTDLIHSGFPLIAEGQIAAFYLPNLFFAALFPIKMGYAWNIAFHLTLSITAMAVYLKTLKLDARGIFFGAFVYAFGSTLGGAYYNITCLKVMTWFPLTLILADQLIAQKRRPIWIILGLGFLFSLQMLAGYLQFAVYAILFTGIYWLTRWFHSTPRPWPSFFVQGLYFFAAVVFCAILSFPQLLLTAELAFLSNRAQTTEGFAYVGSYSPLALICLLFPNFEGFFASKLYLGVLPLFFIIAACFIKTTPLKRTLLILIGIAFLLSLGSLSPLYIFLVKILNFNSFRTPVKFIFFAGFFLSVFCAYGVQEIFSRDDKQYLQRSAKTYFIFILVMLSSVLSAYFIFHAFEKPLIQLGEILLKRWVFEKPGHPFAWEHYEQKLIQFVQFGQMVLNPLRIPVLVPSAKILGALIFVGLMLRTERFRSVLYTTAILLLIVDLQLSYSDIRGDYASYQTFYQKNKVSEFLSQHLGNERYFIYSNDPSSAPLPHAKNMLYGIRSANAYSPLILKDYYDLFGSLGGLNDSISNQPVNDEFLKNHLSLLGVLGIEYLVTDRLLENTQLKLILEDENWRIYENTLNQTRFHLSNRYEVIEDRNKLLAAIHDSKFDLAHTILLEEDPGLDISDSSAEGQLEVSTFDNNSVLELKVSTPTPTLVFLGQIFYPGWSASLDGQPVKLLRANYIFQVIAVPAGDHKISLRYDPWHFLKNGFKDSFFFSNLRQNEGDREALLTDEPQP